MIKNLDAAQRAELRRIIFKLRSKGEYRLAAEILAIGLGKKKLRRTAKGIGSTASVGVKVVGSAGNLGKPKPESDFEQDLDYVLAKNRELYERLAK